MVTYRDIAGFPGYRVGDNGSVWSCWTKRGSADHRRRMSDHWRPLVLTAISDGYMTAGLQRDGEKQRRFLVHRLVLEAFAGPCPEGMEARRGPDPFKGNNAIGNLRWAPKSERMDNPIIATGPKLTAGQAAAIKAAADAYEDPARIARRYGVTMSTVRDIRTGRTWASLGAVEG